jgi:hypothetical protein
MTSILVSRRSFEARQTIPGDVKYAIYGCFAGYLLKELSETVNLEQNILVLIQTGRKSE